MNIPQDETVVRIPRLALAVASAEHVSTSVSRMRKLFGELRGNTQWVGACGLARFDIGWEWALVRDVVVVLQPSRITTNVELIDARGLAQSDMQSKVCLLEWIETLAWRQQVKVHALNS